MNLIPGRVSACLSAPLSSLCFWKGDIGGLCLSALSKVQPFLPLSTNRQRELFIEDVGSQQGKGGGEYRKGAGGSMTEAAGGKDRAAFGWLVGGEGKKGKRGGESRTQVSVYHGGCKGSPIKLLDIIPESASFPLCGGQREGGRLTEPFEEFVRTHFKFKFTSPTVGMVKLKLTDCVAHTFIFPCCN